MTPVHAACMRNLSRARSDEKCWNPETSVMMMPAAIGPYVGGIYTVGVATRKQMNCSERVAIVLVIWEDSVCLINAGSAE